MENLKGVVIENKYQLVETIGKGGMGAVYLAKDLKLNTYWAVKVIKKNQEGADLLAEPNMLKMLQHPMLPRITDISESNLYFFIVMDFIDGRTLESIAKERGRIKEELVINWAKQICNALDYLHNLKPNPIIYRDMKPENVMLTKEGNIKIIDFGIAREFKFNAREDTNYLGTRGYAAPEQYRINNSQTDARTDIYGLGVTMYRLLTNKTPDEPPYEIKPVRELDSKLSEGIEHIVIKSTALDPSLRYNNVRELLHDLDNVKMIGSKYRHKTRMRRVKILGTIGAMVFSISMISNGLGDYKQALEDKYQVLMVAGKELRENEDFETAIVKFEEAQKLQKGKNKQYDGYYEIAKTYIQSWDFEKGIEELEAVKEKNNNIDENIKLDYWLGKLYFFNDDYDVALIYFETVNEQEKKDKSFEEDFSGIYHLCKELEHENNEAEKTLNALDEFEKDIDEKVTDEINLVNLYLKTVQEYSKLIAKIDNEKIVKDSVERKFSILEKAEKLSDNNFMIMEEKAIAYRDKANTIKKVTTLIAGGREVKGKDDYLNDSLNEYKKCLEIKKKSNIYLKMADICIELKDSAKAESYLNEAKKLEDFEENNLYKEIKNKLDR